MYSFAQRPDTLVFDEPLYAHYLFATGANHPGREEILLSQENDGNKVIDEMIHKNFMKPVVFFKQMTHHLINVNFDFLSQVSNIIFIRDPKQIISSYAQVIYDVKMDDIGIEKQWELYSYLSAKKQNFVVLDSGEILKNSSKILAELCNAINIPFYNEMLSWPPGPKPEDGVWAKHWYGNVHQSTHFAPQQTSSRPLPNTLQLLYEKCKGYYDLLYEKSLKA